MALLISMMCSITIFLLILTAFYGIGQKSDWKKRRMDGIKHIGEKSGKKQNADEKKSIKGRFQQYLKSSKKKKPKRTKRREKKTIRKHLLLRECWK